MDIQLYTIHVVPFVIIVYAIFVLFIRPTRAVWLASLAGGLVMALINALIDLLAYYASWWHYTASGLILRLPLPFYLTPMLIYGGGGYMLILGGVCLAARERTGGVGVGFFLWVVGFGCGGAGRVRMTLCISAALCS